MAGAGLTGSTGRQLGGGVHQGEPYLVLGAAGRSTKCEGGTRPRRPGGDNKVTGGDTGVTSRARGVTAR